MADSQIEMTVTVAPAQFRRMITKVKAGLVKEGRAGIAAVQAEAAAKFEAETSRMLAAFEARLRELFEQRLPRIVEQGAEREVALLLKLYLQNMTASGLRAQIEAALAAFVKEPGGGETIDGED